MGHDRTCKMYNTQVSQPFFRLHPYPRRPGSQEFRLEAWSELAPVLLALEGHKVTYFYLPFRPYLILSHL